LITETDSRGIVGDKDALIDKSKDFEVILPSQKMRLDQIVKLNISQQFGQPNQIRRKLIQSIQC